MLSGAAGCFLLQMVSHLFAPRFDVAAGTIVQPNLQPQFAHSAVLRYGFAVTSFASAQNLAILEQRYGFRDVEDFVESRQCEMAHRLGADQTEYEPLFTRIYNDSSVGTPTRQHADRTLRATEGESNRRIVAHRKLAR
jgi:hypothetical protein